MRGNPGLVIPQIQVHCDAGDRKVTAGITGLWPPSAESDVAFWFFDVGSSYHRCAEAPKCWIVHPLTGNVSWV